MVDLFGRGTTFKICTRDTTGYSKGTMGHFRSRFVRSRPSAAGIMATRLVVFNKILENLQRFVVTKTGSSFKSTH